MARRFGSLSPLRDSDADAESDAVARVIQALVGGAAYLFELVAGQAVSNESQVTPPNPQGEVGVDLSGPPWGSAVRHPIAWVGGAKPDTAIGYGMSSVIEVPASSRAVLGPWLVWVRPFEYLPQPAIAPYSFGVLSFKGHAASVMVGGTLTVNVRNLSTSSEPMPKSAATTFPIGGTTNEESLVPSLEEAFVALVPGWNIIEIGFEHAEAQTYYIDSVVLNQIVKRTHT